MQKRPFNVAEHVIAKCGGVDKAAEASKRTENWVRKWAYPKEKHGRGGRVPMDDAQQMLWSAKEGKVSVVPADFFHPDSIPEAESANPQAPVKAGAAS